MAILFRHCHYDSALADEAVNRYFVTARSDNDEAVNRYSVTARSDNDKAVNHYSVTARSNNDEAVHKRNDKQNVIPF